MADAFPTSVPGWHLEFEPHEVNALRIESVLVQTRTAYQQVEIVDSYQFGRCLFLDGVLQSAQRDEHIYHECLVHPALLLHPQPERILILGGGEGATLREALRHPSVRSIEMVDLDRELVDQCRRYLPTWHQGLLEQGDPQGRVAVAHQDGRAYLQSRPAGQYDVILCDLPDPHEGGPASLLYTREFYAAAKQRLAPEGILVTQAGPTYFIPQLDAAHAVFYRTLASEFDIVRSYHEYVPSFHCRASFLLASQVHDSLALEPTLFHTRLRDRGLGEQLRFLSAGRYAGLFALPVELRRQLASSGLVSTDAAPWQAPPVQQAGGQR